MKKKSLHGALFADIKNAPVSEIIMCAGETLTIHCDFVISIHNDCVIDFESLAKSKIAFIRTLKRCLANQVLDIVPKAPINL